MDRLRQAVDSRVGAALSRQVRPAFALISAVDPQSGMVKVQVQPEGAETGWISDYTFVTGAFSFRAPSAVGDAVVIVPMEGQGDEYSIVGRYTDTQSPPLTTAATQKHPQTGECVLSLKDGTEIYIAPGRVEIVGTVIKMTGSVTIDGPMTVTGAVSGQSSATFQGDVFGQNTSLHTHVHGGVQSGGSTTGEPQ